MKPVSAAAVALPNPVKELLRKNIGAHGKFTLRFTDSGFVVAKFDAGRSHSKPGVLGIIGSESAKLKLQQYRAEKSLNLRDALFAALAKTPIDADAVVKIATKLDKQPRKGGWAPWSMNWGTGKTADAALQSAVALAHKNVLAMLSPAKGEGRVLSLEVRGVLLALKNGLEERDPVATDRLGQLKRDEEVWINLRHRVFNGDKEQAAEIGRPHKADAQRMLNMVSEQMKALGGHPKDGPAVVQRPLPDWAVSDLPLVADTIRALKKRIAVERLDRLLVDPAKMDASDPQMSGERFSALIKSYEAIHSRLEQLAAGGGGNSSRTTQVTAGGGAQRQVAGLENSLTQLKIRLAEAAATVRQYELRKGGITAEECSAADMTMDLLLDEIGQLEQRDAQARFEALDVGTTTTTVNSTTTTTTTSTGMAGTTITAPTNPPSSRKS